MIDRHQVNQPSLSLNPVVYDLDFQASLADYTIKMVAPASGTHPDNIKIIQSLKQFNIDVPDNLMGSSIAFHANSDEERYKLLKSALFNRSKKTILCALRGGYGSARLINKLEKLSIPKHEKIFIGYSDLTALHLFFSEHWGWHTIHGAGLSELINTHKDPLNLKMIADIIAKKVSKTEITDLKPFNILAKKTKKISGKITGGNLSIIQTSLATSWKIKANDKIIFLEDVGEKGYKVDRILNHLKQAQVFKKVKAIILGEFAASKDEHVEEALERFATDISVPVFKSNQFGHGRSNYPLIYNAKSDIAKDKNNETFHLTMWLP